MQTTYILLRLSQIARQLQRERERERGREGEGGRETLIGLYVHVECG
jgi:hypothetical protein